MTFIHDDPEFDALIRIVSTDRHLAPALVEKDYWVTHTLWALHAQGFQIWFKGGTSLSKGFRLIERFSEDLDVKIEPGRVTALKLPSSWKSDGTTARVARKSYFMSLAELIDVPGTKTLLDPDRTDELWRSADVLVRYPGRHLSALGVMSRAVRLEVGVARVTPFVLRDMTSFVHDKLGALGELHRFDDNRPSNVRCVHPLVTLIEKLDALHRRVPRASAPATFVRHFEDAASIIAHVEELAPLDGYRDVMALAKDMLAQKQIAVVPHSLDPAFAPTDDAGWNAIRLAHVEQAPIFWGARVSIDESCAVIRAWLARATRS